jgi:hypothetical protein
MTNELIKRLAESLSYDGDTEEARSVYMQAAKDLHGKFAHE